MRLLALHTSGHDAGACLFEDGRLVFAVEAERLTRVKHDHRAEAALEHLLAETGLGPADIDHLAFSTNLRHATARVEEGEEAQARIAAGELAVAGWSRLLGPRLPCLVVAHEASHAAVACHAAGWADPCLVLVNEGRGTFSRNALFAHRGGRLELLEHDALPWYATGFGWSALGYLLGLGKTPSAAGTVMALGGYGTLREEVKDLLLGIDRGFHQSPRERQQTQVQPLVDYLARHDSFAHQADLVAAFQELFSDATAASVARHLASAGGGALALSGGCALNLPANTRIRREVAPGLVIPPNCNDAGQALGAALYALTHHFGIRPEPFGAYACGKPLDEEAARQEAAEAGLCLHPYEPARVARALADGAVAAFCRGASELGPRALGHRSLLASASRPGMRRRVSEEIKRRQWFRPLAGVLRADRFRALFPGEPPSPHMLFSYPLPAGLAPEARHADGTSRLQTLEPDDEPALAALLAEYENATGEPVLINTSLNGPGRAIAYTARHVLDDFLDSDVDLFVLGDTLAVRPGSRFTP